MQLQFHEEFTNGMGNMGEDNRKLQDFGFQNKIGPEKNMPGYCLRPIREC